MKLDVLAPIHVIDINGLPLHGVTMAADGLHIGALTRMSDVAMDPQVTTAFPVVAQALLASASAAAAQHGQHRREPVAAHQM